MALETVRVRVVSDSLVAEPGPVADVVVRVYDETGTLLITSGVTGGEGVVEFTLDGGDPAVVYQLRFSKIGASIASPQQIRVYSPAVVAPTPGGNSFEVLASLLSLPQAPNAHQCRASGIVLGPDGAPLAGVDLHFIYQKYPSVVGSHPVLGERVRCRTDQHGFVKVDLIRGACYLATVEDLEDLNREVVVPDRASMPIAHLLFPVVAKVEYDPPGPWTISKGDSLTLIPTVLASDHRTIPGAGIKDVVYKISDPTIAGLSIHEDRLVLRGGHVGTTTLVVTRKDTSIVHQPDLSIDGGVSYITVS